MNANGGHFQFQLKPSIGGGQVDEYWNNLVLGMIGATIEPANMITGIRLVDKLSGPRAANVIRLEVWFSNYDDTQAVGPPLGTGGGNLPSSRREGLRRVASGGEVARLFRITARKGGSRCRQPPRGVSFGLHNWDPTAAYLRH
ncbi:unnamed protein product [Prorocentrum cordatum]|uniref:Uncharacterized protein n=1 Tax=Prorocentrum cordatum TaxID=2364126 RepID=A0ABN9T5A0_9DINO|nr:unnamed protein product [Polarella glacialis]